MKIKTILQLLSVITLAAWCTGYFLMELPAVFHALLMLAAIFWLRSMLIIEDYFFGKATTIDKPKDH